MFDARLKRSLAKAFAVAAFAGAASGCTTLCDQRCNLEQSARAMTNSADVGIRAMGVRTLENLHPEIQASGDQMRSIAVPKIVECTVSAIEVVDGKKVMKLSGCGNPAP